MNKQLITVSLCLTTVLWASCKKESMTTPKDANGTPEAATVLKEGSGFSQSIDVMVKLTEMNSGSTGKLGLYDFNVDRSNQLNLAYYDEWQSQQDKLKTGYRKAFDFTSGKEIAVSNETEYALGRQKYLQGTIEFMPYSSKLVSFNFSDWGSAGYSQAFFGGDISADMPMAPTWQGNYSGGIAYYNVYAEQKFNGGKHYLLVNLLSSSSVLSQYEYLTPAMPPLGSVRPEKPVLANFPDPRHLDGQGKTVVISVRADSVLAYKIDNVMSPAKVYTRTGGLVSSGFNKESVYKWQRHYSASGDKMSMLVYDTSAKKYWTYVYDFTNDILTPKINNANLSYSASGSDIDMDEEGNIYYTGIAGNGSNTAGVSVFKLSPSGISLVGSDNFLKFGEVVKMKFFNGKVHLAVTGNVSGVKAWGQLSILSQN